MKVYTRTGDGGKTSLLGGDRVAKDDPRLEAYGTLDELVCQIGLAHSLLSREAAEYLGPRLERIQGRLMGLSSWLAASGDMDELGLPRVAGVDEVSVLEREMDEMTESLPPLRSFILPGGGPGSSALQVCRTVCRRAERRIVSLSRTGAVQEEAIEVAKKFVNRLSDWLFVAARYANFRDGISDKEWHMS